MPACVRGPADAARVLDREPGTDLGQRLPDGRELDADLGVAGQAGRGELVEQVEVRRDGGLGLRLVEGVLAEEVEGHVQAVVDQPRGRHHRLLGGLTGHVAVDDPAAHRQPGDDVLDPVAAGEHQQRRAENRHLLRRGLTAGPPPPATARGVGQASLAAQGEGAEGQDGDGEGRHEHDVAPDLARRRCCSATDCIASTA